MDSVLADISCFLKYDQERAVSLVYHRNRKKCRDAKGDFKSSSNIAILFCGHVS